MEVEYSKENHQFYKTPAYRLFHFKYEIQAPRRYLMSRFELEVIGMPMTGDPELDADPDGGMDRGMVNVMDMAKIYDRGAKFIITNSDEAILIYRDIQEHLTNWYNGLDEFQYRNRCPLYSLELFEQLAQELHPYAAAHLDGRSEVERGIMGILTLGRHVPVSNRSYLVAPYVSTVSLIKRKMANEKFGLYDPNDIENS